MRLAGANPSGLAGWGAAGVVAALGPAACHTTTIGGVTLHRGTPEAEVRAKLGEPDYSDRYSKNLGSVVFKDFQTITALYYLDRGLYAEVSNGRFLRVGHLEPGEVADLAERARMVREVSATVPVGSPGAEVVPRLGPPDLVDSYEIFDRMKYQQRSLYEPRAALPPGPVELVYCDRGVVVRLGGGVVQEIRPMQGSWADHYRTSAASLRARAKLAAEDPARIGMTSSEVSARWGSPRAVSGVVDGAEVLTFPGLDPAARLGVPVTRLYYLRQDAVVNLADDRVMSIEPLDPERKRVVLNFLTRPRPGERPYDVPQERIR